jgi:hypothetical protein
MVALARVPRLSPQETADDPEFAADAVAGLKATPKRIAAKYFYDAEGSRLFEDITELPEYYPTRCEMQILRDHGQEIGKLIPEGAALVEFGSGSTKKVRILLKNAPKLAAYVPVDICEEMVQDEAKSSRPTARSFRSFRSPPTSASRSPCRKRRAPRRCGSDFFRARRSAISSHTRRPRSCATPARFSARVRC